MGDVTTDTSSPPPYIEEDQRSWLDELFEGGYDECDVGRMGLTLPTGGGTERYTWDRLRAAVIDRQPFLEVRPLSADVRLSSITARDVEALRDGLDNAVPRLARPCVVQSVCVRRFGEVTYYDAEMKNGKLLPPRMVVDVGRVAPHSSVRVNTGYVFKIPAHVDMLDTGVGGTIVKTGHQKQPPFVIVPQLMCDNHIVPTVYARDPEDTGPFTVNFSTETGEVGKVRVVLKAYRVTEPLDRVCLVDREQTSNTVFKSKDQKPGRHVINPKTKVVYESMTTVGADVAQFRTYDPTLKRTYDRQRLNVARVTTLAVSRKREWADPRLVTLTGLFVPARRSSPAVSVAPTVADGSDYGANTHCLVFVDYRLTLFSSPVTGGGGADVKLFNGAFCDTPSYKEVAKAVRKVVACLEGLAACAYRCKKYIADLKSQSHPPVAFGTVLRVADHLQERAFANVMNDVDEMNGLCSLPDWRLSTLPRGYDGRRPGARRTTYSGQIYRAFSYLVSVYFAAHFTPDQIEALTIGSTVPASTVDVGGDKKVLPVTTGEEEVRGTSSGGGDDEDAAARREQTKDDAPRADVTGGGGGGDGPSRPPYPVEGEATTEEEEEVNELCGDTAVVGGRHEEKITTGDVVGEYENIDILSQVVELDDYDDDEAVTSKRDSDGRSDDESPEKKSKLVE